MIKENPLAPEQKAAPAKDTIAGKEEAKAIAIVSPPVPVEKQDPALAVKKASEYFDEFFGLVKDLLKEPAKDEEPNVVLKVLDLKHYQRVISESMSPAQKWPLAAAYAAMAYATQQEAKRIAAVQSVIDFKAAEKAEEVKAKEAKK